jgi:hypothetical protein
MEVFKKHLGQYEYRLIVVDSAGSLQLKVVLCLLAYKMEPFTIPGFPFRFSARPPALLLTE